ncbi:NAD-dependent succinate-semialdehyde dehydrogenase [Caulobacter sp. SL161]|uniref:NAD-dependent succinate-semialdehyde dehydrogenase n=1 Tax=Caulobacter sp. SL161 TaxID=2995156 RepID=UPI0022744C8F|nr:NAD-dependent succinate-semialdehyde dehydrogenase [Caulobacter sp. SL161]MCY1646611.1 NAD-dependent succinate-semialdehyde dehydrogenase [Caulobacter sp. SL161]
MAPLTLKDADLLREDGLIAGAWRGASSRIPVRNPADDTHLADVADLGAAETEEAVSAAHAALTAWGARSAKERSAILRRWADLMIANADDLAVILTAEQGKPLAEAKGEVVYAAGFLEWFAEEARRVQGEVLTPHRPDMRLVVSRAPVGVVAAVTPWNFPLAMITRKAGPALAVGCTMVLKPSELTPLSALALARLAERAGVPAGVFNVVTGQAAPIGEVLTGDPRVRKFTFTGSTRVGKLLAARCVETVKRVSLELGGNAPFIVFDDADLDAAVEGAIASKFRNTGQTCVCANRFLVQEGVYEDFARRLAERVGKLVVGAGLEGPTDQGPLINAAALGKVRDHIGDALAGGARVMVGGQPLEGPGAFHQPTVLADVDPKALLCREETFGPVAGLVRFRTEAEAIALANDTTAGLAAYLFTRDLDRSTRVSEALAYGMVGLNTGLISTEVAPFGGIKESGLGREGSHLGVDDYLDIKLVCRSVSTRVVAL